MNESTSKNTARVIGALLLGAAVGASLAILLAPDKGSETRRRLFNGAKDLAEDLKDKLKPCPAAGEDPDDPEKDNPV